MSSPVTLLCYLGEHDDCPGYMWVTTPNGQTQIFCSCPCQCSNDDSDRIWTKEPPK
jgi:hypothetical protein